VIGGIDIQAGMVAIILSLNLHAAAQSFQWGNDLPEDQGFSAQKLYAMRDTLMEHGTKALLVIRNDEILLEWYASGWHPERRHYTASLAKSLVGGMSLSLALDDERVNADDPAWKFIPQWQLNPRKSQITLRHLATHTSGLEDARPKNKGGWKQTFWERRDPPNDPFTLARDQTPLLFEPGSQFQYSNPGMAMLAYAVTSAYRGSGYPDIRALLRERIFVPVGLEQDDWSIGYGRTYRVDGLDLVANWGGGNFTPRAVARIGRLMLRQGNWEGHQLIDSSCIMQMVEYTGTPLPPRHDRQPAPASTLCWYNNFDGIWQKAPHDTYLGAGAENQHLIIIPGMNIIVVRNGASMYHESNGEGFYYGVEKYLVNMLMDALIEMPYPGSELIRDIEFASADSVIRIGCSCDNWPVTWADDGHLYTAGGDGKAFGSTRKSMWFCRITGNPPDISGENIKALESNRDGSSGKKGSGLLCVDGTIYLWVRNADRNGNMSQLAWSVDHGQTWSWSKWKFEKFGYPAFINFGKNYREARDQYVYTVTPDDKSAYATTNKDMILLRVPAGRITGQGSYECFAGFEGDDPRWSRNMDDRKPVFTYAGTPYNTGRTSVSYNPGIGRYLWWQILEEEDVDERDEGGFAIYEAPKPWGPWRTVYFTKNWDMGPGECASIPTKWMSRDGKTCYLVFSGQDCFSVRKFILEIHQ